MTDNRTRRHRFGSAAACARRGGKWSPCYARPAPAQSRPGGLARARPTASLHRHPSSHLSAALHDCENYQRLVDDSPRFPASGATRAGMRAGAGADGQERGRDRHRVDDEPGRVVGKQRGRAPVGARVHRVSARRWRATSGPVRHKRRRAAATPRELGRSSTRSTCSSSTASGF